MVHHVGLPLPLLADRTLAALADRRPADAGALASVPGLGPLKAERYGPTLLALMAAGGRRSDEAEG